MIFWFIAMVMIVSGFCKVSVFHAFTFVPTANAKLGFNVRQNSIFNGKGNGFMCHLFFGELFSVIRNIFLEVVFHVRLVFWCFLSFCDCPFINNFTVCGFSVPFLNFIITVFALRSKSCFVRSASEKLGSVLHFKTFSAGFIHKLKVV